MKQYIDKDTLENILRRLWKEDDGKNSEHRICYNKALQDVQCEMDSREDKAVDLEKEIHALWSLNQESADSLFIPMNYNGLRGIAKHFFELGLKAAQKGE